MTRKEEIRNAIDAIIPIFPPDKGRTYEQALMAAGFEAGAKWADEHPVNAWHDASEEPKGEEEYILHYSEYYNNWFINPLAYIIYCCYDSWSEAVEKESIKQWAYLKDLLPKIK